LPLKTVTEELVKTTILIVFILYYFTYSLCNCDNIHYWAKLPWNGHGFSM